MNAFNILKVSASAISAQRQRLNVMASNLANVHSTRTENGEPYRRKDVVFSAFPIDSTLNGVTVAEIVEDPTPFNLVYDPSHPDADSQGYVKMPNINIIEEITNMMMAFRAYEASVSAFNISKSMFVKALEIGRV
ncbi:MAG: flagellar basal-body rod protein FlgC [Deltaproteobacteria bacterium]|nr:Flagellar basal-body rod protein FlgC [bacterium HR37]GIW46225.1 MAG: flagellar basal-body rod protein FlgC [Deltaproteobacteria bacterium]